jgi:hypothetical protein
MRPHRRTVELLFLAAGALAWCVLRLDLSSKWWQSVCVVTFSPDGKTLAAGLRDGKTFNEDFHWCISDVGRTVALFDAESGGDGTILVRERDGRTFSGRFRMHQRECFSAGS